VNPRQRRGLTFIVVAMMVAVGTFVAVTSYTASVNSQVGSRVTVYRATQPIEASRRCRQPTWSRPRSRNGGSPRRPSCR